VRVREFITQRLGEYSATGVVRQLYARLQTLIVKLESQAAAQVTGISEARAHTESRGGARLALRQALEAINSVARAMGVAKEFPLPERDNDDNLLSVAKATVPKALARKAEFLEHEMPADFIEDLQTDITALETATADHVNAVGDHIEASDGIDETDDEIDEVIDKLDAILRPKYAGNRPVLTEWLSARHVERAPRRNAGAPPPPPSGVTPTPQ
jgi:hypothetical protein